MAKIELQNVDHSTEDAVMAKPELQNITTNNPTEETVSNRDCCFCRPTPSIWTVCGLTPHS